MATTPPSRLLPVARKPTKKAESLAKPLKRPLQARAKFTVQAIYDAFVKLWRAHGWEGVTTRAVALETGISVGTLYEYFPNKESLLSGYFRYCMESLIAEIDRQVIHAKSLTWEQRVRRLVRLTCGMDAAALPYFDSQMFMLEYQIAEPKHHRRVYEELSKQWIAALDACDDLPQRLDANMIKSLYLSVWGGKRYFLLVGPTDLAATEWALEMERFCCAAIAGHSGS